MTVPVEPLPELVRRDPLQAFWEAKVCSFLYSPQKQEEFERGSINIDVVRLDGSFPPPPRQPATSTNQQSGSQQTKQSSDQSGTKSR